LIFETILLAAIAFLGALIFGITGFGAALVTIPLATHLVPLKFALALYVLADLACALSVGLEKPKNALRAEWTRLVPMIVAGTALGVTLLVNLPRQAAMLALGVFVSGYALYSLKKTASEEKPVSAAWAWLAGLAGGITVVDSYAHHPTEIRTDVAAMRPARSTTMRSAIAMTSSSL